MSGNESEETGMGGKHEDKDQKEIEGDGRQKDREVPKDTGKGGGKREK